MTRKIAFFDFDDTLVDCQSITILWKFAIKKQPYLIIYLFVQLLIGIIKYIFTFNFSHIKTSMVSLLKFLSEEDLKFFANNILNPKYFYRDGIKELEKFGDDYLKFLVSASPLNYMKYFKDILSFDYIIATELDENFKVKSKNNSGHQKVLNINKYLDELNIKIDYENSYCYTDNYKADRFMANLVENKFLINSKLKVSGFKNLYWKKTLR